MLVNATEVILVKQPESPIY